MWWHVFPFGWSPCPPAVATRAIRAVASVDEGGRRRVSSRRHADAPGRQCSGARFAERSAGRVSVLFHRADVHHLLRAGARVLGPDRPAHGVRDARRRPTVAGVVASSRAPVLLPRPLVGAAGLGGAGPAGRGPARRRRPAGDGRDRRHAVSPARAEGARRVLVPRRVRAGQAASGVRQQLGDRRDRGPAVVPGPAAGVTGRVRLGV